MIGSLKVPVIFSAVDKISSVIEKVEGKTSGFRKKLGNIANAGVIAGTAILTGLTYAGNEAVKFEDKMADVAKVMNLDIGSDAFNKIGNEVKDLAIYLAQTPEDAAELFANLSQGGVAAKDVGKVAKIAGEVGVAFGISAGQAGESFIKLSNSMGLTIDQTAKVTDALNHLGNTTSASSAELFEFMASGGAGAGRFLGLAGEEAAAFGSVLISVGKSASESGTIFERMMKGIFQNASMKKSFDQAGGGLKGVMAVIEKGANLKGAKQFEYFANFGQYGTDISLFAKNLDQLKGTLGSVDNQQKFANSSLLEFENRQKTTAVQMQKLKTQVSVLAIEIGTELLPIVGQLLKDATPFIKKLIEWVRNNKELIPQVLKIVAALYAFKAIMLLVNGVIIAYNFAYGIYIALMTKGIVAIGANKFAVLGFNLAMKAQLMWLGLVEAATWLWNVALYANPIGLIVLAIILLIAYIVVAIVYWDEFGAAMLACLGPLGWLINGIMELIKYWDLVVQAFEDDGIIGALMKIDQIIKSALIRPMEQFLNLIKDIPGVGEFAQKGLDNLARFREMAGLDLDAQLSEGKVQNSPLQSSAATGNENYKMDFSGGININDPGGLVDGTSGFNGIPVKVTRTQGNR